MGDGGYYSEDESLWLLTGTSCGASSDAVPSRTNTAQIVTTARIMFAPKRRFSFCNIASGLNYASLDRRVHLSRYLHGSNTTVRLVPPYHPSIQDSWLAQAKLALQSANCKRVQTSRIPKSEHGSPPGLLVVVEPAEGRNRRRLLRLLLKLQFKAFFTLVVLPANTAHPGSSGDAFRVPQLHRPWHARLLDDRLPSRAGSMPLP